jgi:hypothetical protein
LQQNLHPKTQKNAEKMHQENISVIPSFYFSQQATSDRKKRGRLACRNDPKSFFQSCSADALAASINKTKTRVIRGPPAPFVGRKFSKIS